MIQLLIFYQPSVKLIETYLQNEHGHWVSEHIRINVFYVIF